ncbi:HAD family phosphatase [Mucilaginibacter gynuensis]|uniref:HAD family phosphatase n=1 Tax=Mucilaginibacter gynuensis TaxID=1302236 RepID=A0ABP8GDJ3_9SPHI
MLNGGKTIKALFLDIGGVMLTNGWDTAARVEAANIFSLDFAEMNGRHRIIFDAYESGKTTLDEYLDLLVFYEPRAFSKEEFKTFMAEKSQPYPDMLKLISDIKHKYNLRTIAVNNEGRELNEYRVKQFNLRSFIDVFASSCYIHVRKPDKDIYNMAIDLAQVDPDEAIYVDDRLVFIQAAQKMGINTIHHTDISNTIEAFATFGIETENLTENTNSLSN